MVYALPTLSKDKSIAIACILALFTIIRDETGSEVVCANAGLTIHNTLLIYTLKVSHNNEVDTKAMTKSCLGIGGLYGSDMACMKYAMVDAETIFMIKSRVVHIGSFDGGPESLQKPASECNVFDMIQRIFHHITSARIGKQDVNKVPFTVAFSDILDYFTSINMTDDRRDSIIFLIKKLQDVLPK
ncbi:hypothetical protein BLNAU_20625 [Blattamonas nauphoetae]|uniref:Uncharacterized protein n=1 Tax=Blattamonas nauphoetae TaxID=2049346 RepID=A0ABQ9WY92_9EUKA|nr:hypothetical protein BLNAU_20625 [Blattamonas nauphoetae]